MTEILDELNMYRVYVPMNPYTSVQEDGEVEHHVKLLDFCLEIM